MQIFSSLYCMVVAKNHIRYFNFEYGLAANTELKTKLVSNGKDGRAG